MDRQPEVVRRVGVWEIEPPSGQISRNGETIRIVLTAGMSHEYFADGITEEVIDKLSKTPDLLVAPPTSSFYLKNKQIAIAEIAKRLHVAYVLDGSVRKSGETLRVAVRLSRGDNGYVTWSQTYDRPFKDLLAVQADIAMQVAKALKASIDTT